MGLDVHNVFDLLVGTSTGSIVAAAVAIKYNLAQLDQDYEKKAKHIFPKYTRRKLSAMCGKMTSMYDSSVLEEFLRSKFDNRLLGEVDKPLILNATNISVGCAHVFKSRYQKEIRGRCEYIRDGSVPVYKAVLASCAAPSYFAPVDVNGTLICDGGLWANNPAMVGFIEALTNFRQQQQNIRILSIGTGNISNFYRHSKWWGLLTGWRGTQLVDLVMNAQTQFPQNSLNLLLNKQRKTENKGILRINPEICNWSLDNCECIPILKKIADAESIKQGADIMDFLQ